MLRSGLVLLLLTHYLLVVGAGLVNRPQPPRYSAAHPYVHRADCQQKHYLMVDCFDTCNGDQHVVQKRTAGENAQHLLTLMKGVDAHMLAETISLPPVYPAPKPTLPAELRQSVPPGFAALVYAPPRRG
ncbi:hypothetical protein [Hymenobacter chitinivorans]|uniref:Uncharacterized protein n=1 Tax=Hymenobacter chitinivorans DSM 11115 TaxID=1121954 RepID=A0A2M9B9S8_9BACT|nr:hypothetical protein [Hymenobacter chitinivorans]PJJ54699.1 hypothetical protein CLV45_3045 [Hymenobacter chitinivorans DSM 11115]